jgi:restriction endonuclease S subunit
MKLGDVAGIKSGLVLARKAADTAAKSIYSYKQFNLKSFRENGTIDLEQLDNYESNQALTDSYLTRNDDLVVRLTVPNTAVLIGSETENIVVSSHFLLIRVERQKLLPEFLYWFLNSEEVKREIQRNITGLTFEAVKPRFYNDLTIRIPPLTKQRVIADIYFTARNELRLLEELHDKKAFYYKQAIASIYQNEMKRSIS